MVCYWIEEVLEVWGMLHGSLAPRPRQRVRDTAGIETRKNSPSTRSANPLLQRRAPPAAER